MTMNEPVVAFEGVGKRFGATPALEGIDLSVREGEFVTLIGPSGCGKSTLLRMIAGLTRPSEGALRVAGAAPGAGPLPLFYVFQEPTLLPWRRTLKNVELPLEIRGDAPEQRTERARQMLDLVGLKGAASKFPWQLSGGMRMRVSIARALAVAPKILLLDEPFGALDEMTRDRLDEDLLRIRERDPFTAFFVTHSVAEAVFLSSKVVILSPNPGRIRHVVDIPLPFPRKAEVREQPDYLRLLARTGHLLREVSAEGVR